MTVSNIRSASKFKQTVLVIDDQPTVLDIHTAILKSLKLNLKVVPMVDPVEALLWMRNKQVDLIVSDFSMMNMDAMQFIQIISEVNYATPIIIITVLKDKQIHKELLDAGAIACLTKPVNAEKLETLARFLLNESKQFYNHNQVAKNK